ncbi:2-dehydro-3-deoxyglucarate aldolase [Alkaliphilus metalliredigens QYMF]|uniref:2-dehydro-3-deoxyglucarate aldolase n=1 Tax=Alkaliphilus metalliredigens (strain QYMF) TaxID=293826 RepID=A6TKL4_ALKMQ|nr:aldolase/citrate lyase family protein [Alkaliphilus metalliredigens]ABR46732.1 2-dehydro-3-deoxyglucarate aldolase [Alkaliphilus metalliredigens QYMF]
MSNRIQNELSEGKYVVGPFMKLASPAIVEIMGKAGFDYVIIDCEHGPTNMLQAEDMVRAAKLVGISPVIRVSANDPVMISRALDIGADAVQVPQISTKEDAERVAKAAKFAPLGERGSCPYVRAAEYSHLDKKEYFKKANEETMVIIHIEGEEGAKNIDEILSVEGIDVIFIGPYDLSQSLGVPGEVDHPKVVEMMEMVVEKAKGKGKTVGTFVESPEGAHRWIDLGVQYISYAGDTGIIYQACKDIMQQIQSVEAISQDQI